MTTDQTERALHLAHMDTLRAAWSLALGRTARGASLWEQLQQAAAGLAEGLADHMGEPLPVVSSTADEDDEGGGGEELVFDERDVARRGLHTFRPRREYRCHVGAD